MKKMNIVELGHQFMKAVIKENDIVLDMTMGNGYDTVFLAQIAKMVYAFDIQDEAIKITKTRCQDQFITNVKLIHDTHENAHLYVPLFHHAVYNLGYLPNGDKIITTIAKTTIKSLKRVLKEMESMGYVFITVYEGHEEGLQESIALKEYLHTLHPQDFQVFQVTLPYQDQNPPYLLIIQRLK
ncbi:MAG: class I SAM-dependent methyltransferase [Acholeplasmataceae bacterium]